MSSNRFVVVNAFSRQPFGGNPAAVFPEADGIPDEQLLPIARQLNLVETVFVYASRKPGVQRRLRYFTPSKELPVAGHPTIAAWVALATLGLIDTADASHFVQETAAGLQTIRLERDAGDYVVFMQQPLPRFLEIIKDRWAVAEVLSIPPEDISEELPIQVVDTGLPHIIVPVCSLDGLMRMQRNVDSLGQLCRSCSVDGVQGFCFETFDPVLDLHTRNICPRAGVEDPACGMGNGALGAYLAKYGFGDSARSSRADEFVLRVEQGHTCNFPSIVEVRLSHSAVGVPEVTVGGAGVLMLEGEVLV